MTTETAADDRATEPAVDALALDRQLCFALAAASRSVIGVYKPILEPMGLTHPQYLVMLALWEREPRSLSEIANLLRLEPATLSPMVKRLEAAGLVVRERSSHDERQLALRLTPSGRALRAQAELVPPQVVAALGVDVEELMELHARLTAILERIAPLEERAAG
ncbi:MarR family winged helix-turn-helix transcriptional regulator [Agromyces sp. MMS24-K17]|uniref:MarR family winged helix-turn-helix transcriptional regulator n=1 Tax=Agromyces sp. MMS24-K17 TaxID=3372850 RepID=UPI003754C005